MRRWLRCFVRGLPFAVAVGVLVGATIAYTGARVTSGISLAIAVVTVDAPISADQFSRVAGFVRNYATAKAIARVNETVASPIAHHARR